ncbi:hypothetical protein GCM10010495_78370 [Kitasatospora herbaricolor]|nr:hypothetical protein GCM10010495_78370 [Kitasatospora herbaricolor]
MASSATALREREGEAGEFMVDMGVLGVLWVGGGIVPRRAVAALPEAGGLGFVADGGDALQGGEPGRERRRAVCGDGGPSDGGQPAAGG